jgi:hypothetical protein
MNRLFDVLRCKAEILQFLKDERVINDDQMQSILHSNHTTHSTRIAGLLDESLKADKLQLVDYEWTILPHERLSLTLVSQNAKKEFVYNT